MLTVCLTIIACFAALPIMLYSIECALAVLARYPVAAIKSPTRDPVAVLVPAHNEAGGISATLGSILNELAAADRLLVVADNCDDSTAAVSSACGAEVVARHDSHLIGKGYALAFGIEHLLKHPESFSVLIVIDADCLLSPGAIAALADQVARTRRPAQAVNLLQPPHCARAATSLSALAFAFKNLVRPLGLHALGLPVPLTGTGMAIPRRLLGCIKPPAGSIVEDMMLGLAFAEAGAPPALCPSAQVTSPTAATEDAERTQRVRWEHGHLYTLLTRAPGMFVRSVCRGRIRTAAMALDLAVPPLSLVVLIWLVTAALAGAGTVYFDAFLALWIVLASGAVLLATMSGAYFRFCRTVVPPRALLALPYYVARKMPLYVQFLLRRERRWVRTSRDGPSP